MIVLAFVLVLQTSTPDVVINGRRLPKGADVCATGTCTPGQDVDAAIDNADLLFRQGRHREARKVLAAAISRNRRFADSDPKAVAALYRAFATVTLHDGDLEAYKSAIVAQVSTLRSRLPPTDPAAIGALIASGDMWVKLKNAQSAASAYRAAAREAVRRGQPALAVTAVLRQAWLASATGDVSRVRRMIDVIEAMPAGGDPVAREGVRVLRLHLAAQDPVVVKPDRSVAGTTSRPALIWSPPYELGESLWSRAQLTPFDDTSLIPSASLLGGSITWTDIGFRIMPDGHTADAEVLGGTASPGWTRALLTQIAGRRYASRLSGTGEPGVYRVERFSYRATYETPTGSHVRQRVGQVGLEVVDLTDR